MNKNDIVTVEITDIGVSGEGIGHVDGYTLFIKDAVIGDVVESYHTVRISRRTKVCICQKMRRLPDPGNVL